MRTWTDEQCHAMGYIATFGPTSANQIAAHLRCDLPKYEECENALEQALIDAQAACLLLLALDLIYPYNAPFECSDLKGDEEPVFESKDERFHAAHAQANLQYKARLHQSMVDRGVIPAGVPAVTDDDLRPGHLLINTTPVMVEPGVLAPAGTLFMVEDAGYPVGHSGSWQRMSEIVR